MHFPSPAGVPLARVRLAFGILTLCSYGACATAPYLDLDADGTVDFREIVEQLNIPPLGSGVRSTLLAERTLEPENGLTESELEIGTWVNESASWAQQVVATGHFGIRFRSGNNTHYGWVELHNPTLLGRPMLRAGGVIRRIYYNPVPGQPYAVGDTTLRARVNADPSAGTITIRFNTDAGAFDSPLKIESRPAVGSGTWSPVASVTVGSAVTLPMPGEARLYRVVQ